MQGKKGDGGVDKRYQEKNGGERKDKRRENSQGGMQVVILIKRYCDVRWLQMKKSPLGATMRKPQMRSQLSVLSLGEPIDSVPNFPVHGQNQLRN